MFAVFTVLLSENPLRPPILQAFSSDGRHCSHCQMLSERSAVYVTIFGQLHENPAWIKAYLDTDSTDGTFHILIKKLHLYFFVMLAVFTVLLSVFLRNALFYGVLAPTAGLVFSVGHCRSLSACHGSIRYNFRTVSRKPRVITAK